MRNINPAISPPETERVGDMSQSSLDCPDHLKNIIQHWYVVKKVPLKGIAESGDWKDVGLIRGMEIHHGFAKSKDWYERFFKKEAWTKNHTKEDWAVVRQKCVKRKAAGKDTEIYLDNERVDKKKRQKEFSRAAPLPSWNMSSNSCQEIASTIVTPSTPTGFSCFTPEAQTTNPTKRLDFRNLPFLSFLQANDAATFHEIAPYHNLRSLEFIKASNDDAGFIQSVLPISHFQKEHILSTQAVSLDIDLHGISLGNFALYALSNNAAGANCKEIYDWLSERLDKNILQSLAAKQTATIMAAMESVFCFACEEMNVPVIDALLAAGVNPNNKKINPYSEYSNPISCLEFACRAGNSNLARILIKSGACPSDLSSTHYSDLLILAILGAIKPPRIEDIPKTSTSQIEVDGCCSRRKADSDLLELATILVQLGADVNMALKTDIFSHHTQPLNRGQRHSPLSAASKGHFLKVVKFLVAKGASVNFITSKGTSVLQECLYSWENLHSPYNKCTCFDKIILASREFSFCACTRVDILELVQVLLDAHIKVVDPIIIGVNEPYAQQGSVSTKFSTIELSILTGISGLVEKILPHSEPVELQTLDCALSLRNSDILFHILQHGVLKLDPPGISELYLDCVEWDAWYEVVMDKPGNSPFIESDTIKAIMEDSLVIRNFLELMPRFERHKVLGADKTSRADLRNAVERSFRLARFEVLKVLVTMDRGIERTVKAVITKHLKTNCFSHRPIWIQRWQDFACGDEAELNLLLDKKQVGQLQLADKPNRWVRNQRSNHKAVPRESTVISQSHSDLACAIYMYRNEIAQKSIESDVDLNKIGFFGGHSGTPLCAAIMADEIRWIEYLLQEKVDVNRGGIDYDGRSISPIIIAIRQKNQKLVERLVDEGANFPEEDIWDESEFDYLAVHKEWTGSIKGWKHICEERILEMICNEGWRLGSTCELKRLEICLEHGANPNIRHRCDSVAQIRCRESFISDEFFSFSLLEIVSRTGKLVALELLLKHGAQPDIAAPHGLPHLTALQWAAIESRSRVTETLLRNKAMPNGRCDQLFREVYAKGFWGQKILEYHRWTPLQLAVSKCGIHIVTKLLEYGADVNQSPAENGGATALQLAARRGHLGLVVLLCDHGAEVNAPGLPYEGNTALEEAAKNGRLDVVQYLLNKGAKIYVGIYSDLL